jgi:hypothetical protein
VTLGTLAARSYSEHGASGTRQRTARADNKTRRGGERSAYCRFAVMSYELIQTVAPVAKL